MSIASVDGKGWAQVQYSQPYGNFHVTMMEAQLQHQQFHKLFLAHSTFINNVRSL
jgi:hypothetical protein